MQKEIIINSRKLNFIQRYLFDKKNKTIENILNVIHILLIFVLGSLVMYTLRSEDTLKLFIPSLTFFFIFAIWFPNFKNKQIFKKMVFMSLDNVKEIRNILKNSWIINEETLRKAYSEPYMSDQSKVMYRTIKDCYGHPVFNEIKRRYAKYNPELFAYIENPNKKDVAEFMYSSYKPNRDYKIRKPFTFEVFDTNVLKKYYAQVRAINLSSKFNQKAIDIMKKEELVSFLDAQLVKVPQ